MKHSTKNRLNHIITLLLSLAAVIGVFAQIPVVSQAAAYSSWLELQAEIDSGKVTTITLTQDLIATSGVSKPLTFSGEKSWVLDLNGCTLDRACYSAAVTGQAVVVDRGATLTIKDSSGTNRGRITGGWAKSNGAGVYVSGTLNLEGGVITGNQSGEAGGGIYSRGGTVHISGGAVTGNTAKLHGAGIFTDENAELTITGGEISGNTSLQDGGGVFMKNGTLNMSGGTVSNNRALTEGAGIYMKIGTLVITGGTISKNSAMTNGAGIFLNGSTAQLSGVTIVENVARGIGGAACLSSQSTMAVTGSQILKNSAVTRGGAFAVVDGSCTVSDSEILYNVGGNSADGLFYNQSGTLDTTGCSITNPRFVSSWNELQSELKLNATASDMYFALAQDIVAPASGSEPLRFPGGGMDWVVDLNGHAISRNFSSIQDSGHVLVVQKGGTLTIRDSSGANSGKITGGYSKDGGGIYVYGTLNFEGGTIMRNTASQYGGGIYLQGGTANISGGVITENEAGFGGGIFANEHSTVNIADCTVKHNPVDRNGGGIVLLDSAAELRNVTISDHVVNNAGGLLVSYDSVCTATDCVFTNNKALERGGSITVQARSELYLNNCDITSSVAVEYGGGVYAADNSTFTMNGGTVRKNIAQYGAGLCLKNTTAEIRNVTISENNTSDTFGLGGGLGGGLYVVDGGKNRVTDCEFYRNVAFSGGGVLVRENAKVVMSGCLIQENSSTIFGGGITSSGQLEMDACSIEQNESRTGGGMALNGPTHLDHCKFLLNRATGQDGSMTNMSGHGGAVWMNINGGVDVWFDRTEFRDNTAGSDGGGLYATGNGNLILHDCILKKNHANRQAGGIFTFSYIKLNLLGADIQENTDQLYCGGVMATNTNVSLKECVVIKNNKSAEGLPRLADLALVGDHTISKIVNPGLTAHSYIHIGSDTRYDVTLAEDISKYQMKYFHADNGTKFQYTKKGYAPIIGSLFGSGSLVLVIGIVSAGAAALAAALIIKKRKNGKAQSNEEGGDDDEA